MDFVLTEEELKKAFDAAFDFWNRDERRTVDGSLEECYKLAKEASAVTDYQLNDLTMKLMVAVYEYALDNARKEK